MQRLCAQRAKRFGFYGINDRFPSNPTAMLHSQQNKQERQCMCVMTGADVRCVDCRVPTQCSQQELTCLQLRLPLNMTVTWPEDVSRPWSKCAVAMLILLSLIQLFHIYYPVFIHHTIDPNRCFWCFFRMGIQDYF